MHTVPLFLVSLGATSAIEGDATIVNSVQLVEGMLTIPIALTVQTTIILNTTGN